MEEVEETKLRLLKGENIKEIWNNCEIITHKEKKTTEILIITNFRYLFFSKEFQKLNLVDQLIKNSYSIPLTSIFQLEDVSTKYSKEKSSSQFIEIKRKDHTTVVFENSQKKISVEKLNQYLSVNKLENFFAFEFQKNLDINLKDLKTYVTEKEYERQVDEFNKYFKVRNQKFCSSYPSKIVVPKDCKDEILNGSSEFRSQQRIPIVSWIHNKTNIPLIRSSQPNTGLMGKSEDDEKLIQLYSKSKELYIIDCRPWKNAVGNKFIGKGYENVSNYENVHIEFMNIDNIHVVSKSLEKFITSLKDDKINTSSQECLEWLNLLFLILEASHRVVSLIEDSHPVLVHCSDGWDRTSVVSAISQILLDPYYRTVEGFSVLIEKEWISFGFKFQERNDHFNTKSNEKSPIFYQFIHCILLIWMQFPKSFEFNQKFLFFILEQSYSCLFEKEMDTFSIWNFINLSLEYFLNPMYIKNEETLKPTSETLSNDFFYICKMQYRDEKITLNETMMQEIIKLKKENNSLKRLLKQFQEKKKCNKEEIIDIVNIFQKEIVIKFENEGEDPIYSENGEKKSILSSLVPELPISLFGATTTAVGFAFGGPIGASLGFGLTYLVGNALKNDGQEMEKTEHE
eukprot:gene8744-692_t